MHVYVYFHTVTISCDCAKAQTSASTCVIANVLSKSLPGSVRRPLIRLFMTGLLLSALEKGGYVPGGRWGLFDMDETVDLTHGFARSYTNRSSAAPFVGDSSRPPLKRHRVGKCRFIFFAFLCVSVPVYVIVGLRSILWKSYSTFAFVFRSLKFSSVATQKVVGSIPTWGFLCGGCMFFLYLRRFSTGIPGSSHSPKTCALG